MKTITKVCLAGFLFFLTMCSPVRKQHRSVSQLGRRAEKIRIYAKKYGYSTRYCFMIDMRLQSGLKRFFVYDLRQNVIVLSGLVAHGTRNHNYSKSASFSNTAGSGCTSLGIYKVGSPYYGQYGKAYKLYGLENSNSNAFHRSIVLHGNKFIPDQETYPMPICNSSGCPMVSFAFLNELSFIIDQSREPILLWVYE
jgi:hypothetical protein